MKALALDSAISRMTVAAKNDDKIFISTYDIGMKQSETIVPAIQNVLEKVNLTLEDLDYITCTSGPGSFTGLRLGFSCLKAINLAYNKPIYAIPTLKVYSFPYNNFEIPVVCVIDANKDKFYATIFDNSHTFLDDGDYEIQEILEKAKNFDCIFICGPDAKKIEEQIKTNNPSQKTFLLNSEPSPAGALFNLAEQAIKNKTDPLKDFDGPVYMRASEAEIILNNKK